MENDLLSEQEFQQFKSKDKYAFKIVYEKYFRLVLHIANRCGAESYMCDDIAQETFIRLFNHIDHISDQTHIKNWLGTTARNLSMDHARKRNVEKKFTQQQFQSEQQHEQQPLVESQQKLTDFSSDSDIHELELILIGKLIDQVSNETDDNTFSLFYRDGLSAREIATQKNTPVSTVTNRLSRLRKRFQGYFEQHLKQLHEQIL